VHLELLRNRVLVGATLAILIVAGTINALMYVLSLYFQDPAGLGMSAFEAGLATLPAAAGMIAITPLITPLAVKVGGARAVGIGFLLATAGFAWMAFVDASWAYAALVIPLIVLAVGLGIANGPASSGSTAAVEPKEVGQASGISNMARYIGGSVAVAIVATIFNASIVNEQDAGASDADALASGLSAACVTMAVWAALGVALVVLLRRLRLRHARGIERAAGASAAFHTIPTQQEERQKVAV
jgi:MFS family permease